MPNLAWIPALCFAALLLWSLGKAAFHRFFHVDETVLSAFKLMLKHRDLDPDGIPDAALIDIISERISEAKGIAAPATKNWRRHLVRLLDAEADLIEQIMINGTARYTDLHTTNILLKYGAVEPSQVQPLSVEEFDDAARHGTLYAELDERVWRRQFS